MDAELRTRLTRGAVGAAVYGLGTLPPVHRLPRMAVSLATGAAAGAVVVVGLQRAEWQSRRAAELEPDAPGAIDAAQDQGTTAAETAEHTLSTRQTQAVTVGLGTATGLVMGGLMWVALAADAFMENRLRRQGVRRPRLVMAAGAAVLGGVLEFVDVPPTVAARTPRVPDVDAAPPLA